MIPAEESDSGGTGTAARVEGGTESPTVPIGMIA